MYAVILPIPPSIKQMQFLVGSHYCPRVFVKLLVIHIQLCRRWSSLHIPNILYGKCRKIHEYILGNMYILFHFYCNAFFIQVFFYFARILFQYFIQCSALFTHAKRLISLCSILAFVVKRNWYFMAILICREMGESKGGQMHQGQQGGGL